MKFLLYFLTFSIVVSVNENKSENCMALDDNKHCKEILLKSLNGLYKKNALEIDDGVIFIVDFEDKFKRAFEVSPFVDIDKEPIKIMEYESGHIYVSLFFSCNEFKMKERSTIRFKSSIRSGRRFTGEIQFKFVDCSWEIMDIFMVSAID